MYKLPILCSQTTYLRKPWSNFNYVKKKPNIKKEFTGHISPEMNLESNKKSYTVNNRDSILRM